MARQRQRHRWTDVQKHISTRFQLPILYMCAAQRVLTVYVVCTLSHLYVPWHSSWLALQHQQRLQGMQISVFSGFNGAEWTYTQQVLTAEDTRTAMLGRPSSVVGTHSALW